jgi:uncharacterized protein (DUF305 family)
MTPSARILPIVLLLVSLGLGGAQGGMGPGPGAMGGGMGGAMGGGMATGRGMMSMPLATTDTLSFLQHMIPHHEEAIASAESLLAVTERPELQALLRDIVRTQTNEVERMRSWIGAWYPEADPTAPYEPMMRDAADAPVAELERAWLEDMILHHMMAVHEARKLLTLDLSAHPEVADLANDIVAGQMSEMHLMAGWLSDWFGVDAMAAMHGGGSMGGAMPGMGMMPGSGMGADQRGTGGMRGSGPAGPPAGPGMMQHGGPGMMRHGGPGMMRHAPGGMGGGAGDVVAALARAYLAGRGGDAVIVEVTGPRVTFEVSYREADAEGVLLIDALSGDVVEAPGR